MRILSALLILFLGIPVSYVHAIPQEGALYVLPDKGTYSVGDTIEVKIYADSDGAAVDAVEAELAFEPGALEVHGLSIDGSILESWSTPPSFSNEKGSIRFSGWTKQKFTGKKGLLLTVTFKMLRNLNATVKFVTGAVVAADGAGSNIVATMKSGVYSALPRQVTTITEFGSSDSSPQSSPHEGSAADTASPAVADSGSEIAPLKPPVFVEFPSTVGPGERIVVRGTATNDTRIAVFLTRDDGTDLRSDLMSAGDGSFTYASDKGVTSGVYEVSAVTLAPDSVRMSAPSQKIKVRVRSQQFAAVGEIATFLTDIIPFLAIVIMGALGVGYLVHRHKIEKLKHAAKH